MDTNKITSVGCIQQMHFHSGLSTKTKDRLNMNKNISTNQHDLLREAVILHNSYVGNTGQAGTNPNGFIYQIKKRVCDSFGHQHLNEIPPETLSNMYYAIQYILTDGERSGLIRKEIKKRVYHAIDTSGENYKREVA